MIFEALKKRRLRKTARELLGHAVHCRHMREDIVEEKVLSAMGDAERSLEEALSAGDYSAIPQRMKRLDACIVEVMPSRPFPIVREYVEVLAVALTVAMACRSYIIQPFKIPTGSMQPSLCGIHCVPRAAPGVWDRMPGKLLKWLVWGEWYKEVVSGASGVAVFLQRDRYTGNVNVLTSETEMENAVSDGAFTSDVFIRVGGLDHFLTAGMSCRVQAGSEVFAGQVLGSGMEVAGDHVFVNRLIWNFRQPKRSEVMVFVTQGIPRIDPSNRNKHYIKRLGGLPGEEISIRPPRVFVGEDAVTNFTIGAVGANRLGNGGYRPAQPAGPYYANPYLGPDTSTRQLGEDEYLALGDNTLSSLDSRYWGPVPRKCLLGPGLVVYWPLSARWGPIRR